MIDLGKRSPKLQKWLGFSFYFSLFSKQFLGLRKHRVLDPPLIRQNLVIEIKSQRRWGLDSKTWSDSRRRIFLCKQSFRLERNRGKLWSYEAFQCPWGISNFKKIREKHSDGPEGFRQITVKFLPRIKWNFFCSKMKIGMFLGPISKFNLFNNCWRLKIFYWKRVSS